MITAKFPLALMICLFPFFLSAQNKFVDPPKAPEAAIYQIEGIKTDLLRTDNARSKSIKYDLSNISALPGLISFEITKHDRSLWIEGSLPKGNGRAKPNDKNSYLQKIQPALPFQLNDENQYKLLKTNEDLQGMLHHKMQQTYKGFPVFMGEIILHEKEGAIKGLNGHILNTRTAEELKAPSLDHKASLEIANKQVLRPERGFAKEALHLKKEQSEMVLYVDDNEKSHWAWHVHIIPNIFENWEMLIDAHTGAVLNKWSNICSILGHNHGHACDHDHHHPEPQALPAAEHPPVVGNGTDLNGQAREINVFQQDGQFFMFDDQREMFKSYGDDQNQPEGAILTFQYVSDQSQPLASSNSSTWADSKAVSAHFNGGEAYEYFRKRYGRNSINNQGGSIYSFYDVTENGKDIDNAYWNGNAIFYGNGKEAFGKAIQAGLDVAGHEMCHGVVQNTANLVYQNESGALNESISDFYGVMIENEDWRLGEDVVNSRVFRSGALRNMADPHNGGSSLNDLGYQPRTTAEQFQGSADNGGVHINSGIPNWAMYKIATALDINKTEEMVYRSLENYLTRSSNFVDFRLAMERSAKELFGEGTELQAVQQAFNEVGIGSSGQTGTPAQKDVGTNPGTNLILYVDPSDKKISIWNTEFDLFGDKLVDHEVLSKPSITDNGTAIVYVSTDNIMRFIVINYEENSFREGTLEENPRQMWRNVVISKDGTKVAALTTENDPKIIVFNLSDGTFKEFELYNPTFTEGVVTNNVRYADAMAFDFTGEFLMYDALNEGSSDQASGYTYWDIGFLNVYDNDANTYAEGNISKLVNGLPENVSIGNANFSANSPSIIVMDYLESVRDQNTNTYNQEYSILAANVETGEIKRVVSNNTLGYPSYGVGDAYIVYQTNGTTSTGTSSVVLNFGPVTEEKITLNTSEQIVSAPQGSSLGTWYATGDRILTSSRDEELSDQIVVRPNPATDEFTIEFGQDMTNISTAIIYNVLGKVVWTNTNIGNQTSLNVSVQDWTPGSYHLVIHAENKMASKTIMIH